MGRGRIKSSRTAESREKPLMRGDDARDAFGLGLGLPYIAFVAAADDDHVGAREHISGIAGEGVLDFGLGDQEDRMRGGLGKRASVGVELGGGIILKKT